MKSLVVHDLKTDVFDLKHLYGSNWISNTFFYPCSLHLGSTIYIVVSIKLGGGVVVRALVLVFGWNVGLKKFHK